MQFEERHDKEQYFFDDETLRFLVSTCLGRGKICCLCCPSLGMALEQAGQDVHTLDIDERFSVLNGFRQFDIESPTWLGVKYGLIVCDPPFFLIAPSLLRKTIDMISLYDHQQLLVISYLRRREETILEAFRSYGLIPSRRVAGYKSVLDKEKGLIEFYDNISLGG